MLTKCALSTRTRLFIILGILLTLLPAPAPVQAAPGFDIVPLTILPGIDVRPDFDPRFTMIDHNGTIYMSTSRLNGSARGVYRKLGTGVEPLLVKDQQVLVQQLSGITTLLTIDQVLPVFVDAAGRVYFQNNSLTNPPGGVSHLLRQELGGGLTLLDTQGPISGPGTDRNFLGQVLSDGRWLRQSFERENGVDILTYSRTDGATSQQILRRPQSIITCDDGLESTDRLLSLKSNANGKSIVRRDLATARFAANDCSGAGTGEAPTQIIDVVGGGAHVALPKSESFISANTHQLNDAGQILHGTIQGMFDPAIDRFTYTQRLFKDNVLIHTLTVLDARNDAVEASFRDALLLPDGSVLYSIPPGLAGQPAAGGLFRDGQLVIAGNDPLFAQPVVFGQLGQVNSRGEVIAFWRSASNNAVVGYVLLSKATGRWTNGDGGTWAEPTNWAGEDVPGQGASALFNLANAYTVSTGDRQVGSVEISDGEVTWIGGQLEVIDELRVGSRANQGTTLLSLRDRVLAGEVTVGALPTSAADLETLASVQIVADARLTVSGPLVIGQAGRAGFGLFDGQLTTGETRLGVGAVGSFNTLNGGQWQSGGLLVGEGYPGYVNLGGGVSVQSTTARIGGAPFAAGFDSSALESGAGAFSRVTLGGTAADDAGNPTTASNWSISEDLEVGSGHPGRVQITDGGSAQVAGSLTVDNIAPNLPVAIENWSTVLVSGVETETQQPATLLIGQDLLLGNADGAGSELTISAGGIVDVGRTLSVGHQPGFPSVFVVGTGSTLTAGQAAGSSCTIGFSGGGELVVSDGGTFRCLVPLQIGLGDDDASVRVVSASSLVRAQRIEVGAPASAEPQSTGTLTLQGGRVTADQTLTIWENGTLAGNGDIAGTIINNGTFDPGLEPLLPEGGLQSVAAAFGAQPGTLVVTGSVTLAPTSALKLDLVGSGKYDKLQVNGTTAIDGALTLAFREGYAPRVGDVYTFVSSSATTGTFDTVSVTGLAPGWQYTLTTNVGITTLTSNSNGVATTARTLRAVYLPMISR
ncbi:MAG: hypothetical protein MUD01_00565 [Chloroflexaceae bacterium]|jgi:hypothetical protein|nr:hypothetical protein [Chloroflexaceae bacterium]